MGDNAPDPSKLELRGLMQQYGIHASELADLIGTDLYTVYAWLAEDGPPVPAYRLSVVRDRLARRNES
jgi:hypothetical protein